MKQLTIYYQYALLWYDFLRLKLAALFADTKTRISKDKVPYFVLPNEGDQLLVLNFAEIERLKSIGEVKFRTIGRVKIYIRKKNVGGRLRKKQIKRYRTLGQKAYGISRMNRNVKLADISRECFYCSVMSEADNLEKVYEWRTYMNGVRAKKAKQHAVNKS